MLAVEFDSHFSEKQWLFIPSVCLNGLLATITLSQELINIAPAFPVAGLYYSTGYFFYWNQSLYFSHSTLIGAHTMQSHKSVSVSSGQFHYYLWCFHQIMSLSDVIANLLCMRIIFEVHRTQSPKNIYFSEKTFTVKWHMTVYSCVHTQIHSTYLHCL